MNLLAIFCATLAFFAVGAIWYGVLFSKPWLRAAEISDEDIQSGSMPLIFGLTFLFEMLVATVVDHTIFRSEASDTAIMFVSVGIGVGVMIPAIGINYLYQRKSSALFAIDAGHYLVGSAAMGGVFTLFY